MLEMIAVPVSAGVPPANEVAECAGAKEQGRLFGLAPCRAIPGKEQPPIQPAAAPWHPACQSEMPEWRRISGLTAENEGRLSPRERRAGLRKLFAEVERLARDFDCGLRNADCGLEQDAQFNPQSTIRNPQSFLWDPMRSVCQQLGIAHSRLSALSKEFSGMAAHEIADCIKAEGLKAKLRANLRQFVRKLWGQGGTHAFDGWGAVEIRCEADYKREVARIAERDCDENRVTGETLRWELWKELKSSRRAPEFDRATYALEYGFANFARMRRACLLVFGKTPQQLEFEMLTEIAAYHAAANDLRLRQRRTFEAEMLREPDSAPRPPFTDAWAALRMYKNEWLEAMKAEFGLGVEEC